MSDEIIKIPDIGSGSAEVIEICVAPVIRFLPMTP